MIDPAFFSALPQHLQRISRVEIKTKSRKFENELTLFRFDVVLHVSTETTAENIPQRNVTSIDWGKYANNPLRGLRNLHLVPELREFLRKKLPEYMLPSIFVIIDAIPLKTNGKVDWQALPEAETRREETAEKYTAPHSLTEKVLSDIWSKLLGIERIGIQDHFFNELGGNSLLATQFCSRVRDHFKVALPLQAIFKTPTIKAIADLLEELLINKQQPEVLV